MKDYGKNKESSYLNYLDINNLHKWAISQKLPLGSFKISIAEFTNFITENLNDNSDVRYFLEVDAPHPEK